jgi:hypothetical protein
MSLSPRMVKPQIPASSCPHPRTTTPGVKRTEGAKRAGRMMTKAEVATAAPVVRMMTVYRWM